MAVQAWQHIYASVDRAQSPRNEDGFQTLFYTTSGLTETEVKDIETHLVYFSSNIEPVDRAFFKIPTGKVVLAQIVPLVEPDRFGRKGRYLAHSLVFAAEAFMQLGVAPIQVFEQFPFTTDVEGALAGGDFRTRDIPPVSIDVHADPVHSPEVARTWPTAELEKLILLAFRAQQMARDRTAIAFVGEPQLVKDALEAIFFAVPSALYIHCTFDTYFYHCKLTNNYYWAVGLLESPENPKFVVVDARSRQALNTVVVHPEATYEQWVVAHLEANNLSDIARYKDCAFACCEWLDGRPYDVFQVETASPELMVSVSKVGAEKIRGLLLSRLRKQWPIALADRVWESLYHDLTVIERFRSLRHGFALPRLLDILYLVYKVQGFRTPQREEVQALGSVLQRADHHALRLLHICWTGQQRQLPQFLEHLSEDEYRELVGIALRFRLVDDPFALLMPTRGDTFLDVYLGFDALARRNMIVLIRELLTVGEVECLNRLGAFIPELDSGQLVSLEKIVNKRPDIPEQFQHAISEAMTVLSAAKAPRRNLNRLRRDLEGLRQRAVWSARQGPRGKPNG